MKIKHTALASVLVLIGMLSFACSFSTAHLSSLKVGKDQKVSQETDTFAANDTVYALATVSNAPGKVKVKGQLAVEDVAGEKVGPIPGLEKTLELEGSGTATFTFTPPPDGWPKGKYKIETTMINDKGEQKDQKSASFTVS
jgi:hypothetical protein